MMVPRGIRLPHLKRCGPHCSQRKNLLWSRVEPIRASWRTTSVSIVSDGWTDVRNMPLINVIVVCPKGSMFLNVVDCNGELKNATFIANILINDIESVGLSNVVQVITDNARV
eukprot:Gb_37096 [translate_table: standard]